MDYIMSRSDKIKKKLYQKINSNKNIGYALIFVSNRKNPILYRFIGNTYVEQDLYSNNWSDVKYLPELSWEESKKINKKINFIPKEKQEYWIKSKKGSFFIFITKKIHNIMLNIK